METNYINILNEIKQNIKVSQIKANLAVNSEMVCLYWRIGNTILEQQRKNGWGAKIIEKLSRDLLMEFPNMTGLSTRNLKYMRQFAETYDNYEIVQQVAAQIPWFHNVVIMEKVKNPDERFFYIRKTVQNGWSRNVLNFQIASGLYQRQIENKNEKITNFNLTLPKEDSELVLEIVKDPYKFEFLNLADEAKELDIEKELVKNLRNFLIELGQGFAFVGEQYHLEVGGQDFYIDLLFYHLKLRCFIVIELKNTEFKPEYSGKLNFYINVVNDKLRHKDDKPTIGLILCKSKNKTVAEYSLNNVNQPMGVSSYLTEKEIRENLPNIEELKEVLSK